jgi:hypothetical protein
MAVPRRAILDAGTVVAGAATVAIVTRRLAGAAIEA